ncbi:hypothetical protein OOK31_36045 [Streptomyces sp. NBC_00249]|uniref:hypothetical protein n=1 Tax=Streptomyces sp. NBC_00249 TaxID=2975690 RepID=UPI00224CFCB5|nr:hypothetical protein [Streptomyces sp. NBC_00249]MCX5199234.1 hypothetical protein [Streptomyces sp. NBC_00249]
MPGPTTRAARPRTQDRGGGPPESFRAHVGRALGAGATPAETRAAVRATAPFRMTRTWRALHVLDTLLAEQEGSAGDA